MRSISNPTTVGGGTRRRTVRHGRRAGALLVETLIAVTLLTVGILAASQATVRGSKLQRATAEYVQALNTSRDVLEQIRSGDLRAQFTAFKANPDFELRGQRVEVRFPLEMLLDAYGGAVPATARFRDLDADGDVDLDAASTESASLLPVRIVVRAGNLSFRVQSLLTEL